MNNAFSQNKIYFDKNWKTTTAENAKYYRILEKKNDSLYAIKDYYLNNVLQMDGYTTSLDKDIFHGTINWYHPNGTKSITRNYKKGILQGDVINYVGQKTIKCEFRNNRAYNGTIFNSYSNPEKYEVFLNGVKTNSYSYYKNRKKIAKKTTYFYKKEYENFYPVTDTFYDKNNQIIGVLNYSKKHVSSPSTGVKITFYLEDNQVVAVKSKMDYKNSMLDGENISYHKNGKEWLKGTYKNGRKYNGMFLEGNIKSCYENGIQTEKIKYDKNFNILSKLILKDGKPYEGTEYIYNGVATYSKGKLKIRKDFYDYKQQQIKKTTTCADNKCTIEWYSKQGKFLGTGTSKNNTITDGLEVAYNKLIYYKDERKDSIEKEYKTELFNELVTKTLYKNDTIIWTKTKSLVADTFFHCDYKSNRPYQGIEYNYDYKNEIHYENGKRIKEVAYKIDNETKKLNIQLVKFYDSTSKYEDIIKEINYVNGKEYTLTYKNHMLYNGASWFVNTLFTYKNGKKEGVYQIYNNSKDIVVEEGNYINNQIQGTVKYTPLENHKYPFINHKPSTCDFVDDKPYNGTVSTKKEITNYTNGKKTGICSEYFDVYTNMLARKTTYKNGKKEGKEMAYLIDNKTFEGINKNDKPYAGNFYNLKTNEVEAYIEGKKHGVFITFNDYKIIVVR